MTISSPTFQRLQDGIKSVDDLRVRGPLNAALAWLSGSLVTQLNTQFGAVSQSTSVQIAAHNADAAAHSAFNTLGKHKKWIPANLFSSGTAATGTFSASGIQVPVLDFDQTTAETTHFSVGMPSSWDEGTVTAVFVWTASSGTGGVVWRINAGARGDDDAITIAFGTNTDVTDTLIATGDLHRSPESAAFTIEGTPAANDVVFFRVVRNVDAAGDTLNADARLIGVELYYTINAGVDVA
jgi:hypothetical protein